MAILYLCPLLPAIGDKIIIEKYAVMAFFGSVLRSRASGFDMLSSFYWSICLLTGLYLTMFLLLSLDEITVSH